jgi:spore maturation protein SpmA
MTILPSTILSLRNDYHAINTVNLIPYIILTSFVLTFLGLFLNKLITK